MAATLEEIIAEVDAELDASPESGESKAIIICTHAAPLIAAGRALTGNMPEDLNEEDFKPFTAGLSTFVRRKSGGGTERKGGEQDEVLGRRGKGVGGGWDCVGTGECGFLSGGQERGW